MFSNCCNPLEDNEIIHKSSAQHRWFKKAGPKYPPIPEMFKFHNIPNASSHLGDASTQLGDTSKI